MRRQACARIALDGSAAGRDVRSLARAGRHATRRGRRRSRPGPSTSSIPRAPPASPRASCRATACAGPTCGAARSTSTDRDTVTLLSTPLYSNTTLVVFFPTIAFGGCVILMPKFDAAGYLQLAEQHRVTHTMLVPVQYQRLMAQPGLRCARPVELPLQVQHQRALRRRAQGRRAEALARRPDRVLRHDRGRRHLHPRGAPASGQAAHRRPAGRGQRHPPDRRGRP